MAVSNPFQMVVDVLPSANRIGTEKKDELDILWDESISALKSIPTTGTAISTTSSQLESAYSAITNPGSLVSSALNELKVRKVITKFFEGVAGINKNGKWVSESTIYDHKGHGGDSLAPSDGITIDQFPAFATLPNFFRTTIGTNFFWGIQLRKADWTDPSIPLPPFSEIKKVGSSTVDPEHTGFGGWLPAKSYNIEWLTSNFHSIDEGTFNLNIHSGFTVNNTITVDLIETEAREYLKWQQNYFAAVHPKPKTVLPYKNAVYVMYICTFYPTGKRMQRLPLLVLPNPTWGLIGDEDKKAVENQLSFNIVGIFSELNSDKSFKFILNNPEKLQQ